MADRFSRRLDGLAVYWRPAFTASPEPGSRARADRVPARRVVLVHGSMDRAAAFLPTNRWLDDLDVVLYDRRGYGRSVPVEPGSGMARQVDDLLTVLEGEPATVVGHSFGGLVALAGAERRPDLVTSVGSFEAPVPWLPGVEGPTTTLVPSRAPEDVAEAFMRRMLGDELWERLPEPTRRQRRAEGPALVADVEAMTAPTPPVDLAAVRVPVVVGRGSEAADRHRQGAEALAREVGAGPVVVIERAGHGAHRSHPERFAALVRRAVDLA